jgi:hypothetical protein
MQRPGHGGTYAAPFGARSADKRVETPTVVAPAVDALFELRV